MERREPAALLHIASIGGSAREVLNGVHSGAEAFVQALSLALHNDLAWSDVRVQTVLPGATLARFRPIAGTALEQFPSVLVLIPVDAGIAGLDRRERLPFLPSRLLPMGRSSLAIPLHRAIAR